MFKVLNFNVIKHCSTFIALALIENYNQNQRNSRIQLLNTEGIKLYK